MLAGELELLLLLCVSSLSPTATSRLKKVGGVDWQTAQKDVILLHNLHQFE